MAGIENCLGDVVSKFPRLPPYKVREILKSESPDFEITKSLLNLLHNIVEVGSLPVSKRQRQFLDDHPEAVLRLLNPESSLQYRRSSLENYISLAQVIAESCPTAAGS